MQVLPRGVRHIPAYLDLDAQEALVEDIRAVVQAAPLYVPTMPKTGKPMSVRMTNCGVLGWVTDRERGYRYQATHPETGVPWPPIPERLLQTLGGGVGLSASAGGLPGQLLFRRSQDGPAPGPRRAGTSRRRSSRCRSAIPACSGSARRGARAAPLDSS